MVKIERTVGWKETVQSSILCNVEAANVEGCGPHEITVLGSTLALHAEAAEGFGNFALPYDKKKCRKCMKKSKQVPRPRPLGHHREPYHACYTSPLK